MADDLDLTGVLVDGTTVDADVRAAVTSATITRNLEGASTFELGVRDPDRKLLRSRLFRERTVTTIDGRLFEFAALSKTGSELLATFEDATVADLRRVRGVLSSKAGTTLDAFARRLLDGAPGAKLVAEPGRVSLAPLARGSESEPDEDSWQALTRLAEERAWRCFADGGTVYLGSDAWLRRTAVGGPHHVREYRDGVDEFDYTYDVGQPVMEATFTARASRWTYRPGWPVDVRDVGVGSGSWLIKSAVRSLFARTTTVTVARQTDPLPEPKPEPRDDGGLTSAASSATGGSVTAGPVSARGYSWPVSGPMSSGYGQRGGRLHAGVDLAVGTGTPVLAARAGVVAFAGTADGYGTAVYLDHGGGQTTRYAHLSRLDVRAGQGVAQGERIGASGNTGNSTGPHLHFEVRVGGSAVNPLDYLPARR